MIQSSRLNEGLALVHSTKNGIDHYGYINERGDEEISLQYEFGEDFSNGLALVRLNRKFGYINNKGEIAISFQFEDVDSFKDGKARVKRKYNYFYIDKFGNEI